MLFLDLQLIKLDTAIFALEIELVCTLLNLCKIQHDTGQVLMSTIWIGSKELDLDLAFNLIFAKIRRPKLHLIPSE